MWLRKLHELLASDDVRDSTSMASKLFVLGALPAGDPFVHLPVDCEGEAAMNELPSTSVGHFERCCLVRTFV